MNPQLTLLFTVSALFLGPAGDMRAENRRQPTAASKKIKELKIGDPAPPLKLMKFVKGEPINRFEKGKVYILVFGYMACPACRQMYPYLTELQAKYPNVAIVSVHIWESEQDAPRVPVYVKKIGKLLDYRVAMDANDEMARNWMVAADQNGTPCAFVVDGNGKIVWINHPCLLFDGYREHDLPELGKGKARSTMLEQICSGQWDSRETSDRFAKGRQLRGATAPEAERAAVQAMREMGAEIKQKGMGAPVSEVAFLRETKLMTDAGLKHLKAFKGLRSLLLCETHVTDAGLREINELETLHTLTLGRTQVTDVGLKELRRLNQLQRLYLDGTCITDVGLKELGRLKQLQELSLDNTRVTNEGLRELRSLQKLQRLFLSKSKVTDAGMKKLKELKRLQTLFLDGLEITDAGLEELQALDDLRSLGCMKTRVTGAGFKGFQGLQELYLNGSLATDEGLKGLRNLKKLKRLNLNGTKITDAGLKELQGLANLAELYLNNTSVTDAGLKEFQAMKGLKQLFLEETRVTEAAAANLRKIRPDLTITIVDD